jgi:hypothetical protein
LVFSLLLCNDVGGTRNFSRGAGSSQCIKSNLPLCAAIHNASGMCRSRSARPPHGTSCRKHRTTRYLFSCQFCRFSVRRCSRCHIRYSVIQRGSVVLVLVVTFTLFTFTTGTSTSSPSTDGCDGAVLVGGTRDGDWSRSRSGGASTLYRSDKDKDGSLRVSSSNEDVSNIPECDRKSHAFKTRLANNNRAMQIVMECLSER